MSLFVRFHLHYDAILISMSDGGQTEFNQVIIFVRDKKRAASLNKILVESKFPSVVLSADMTTDER